MTKENKKSDANVCACGCGCSCHSVGAYHWHILLRWFLGLVIIVLVFNLGVTIGELKATVGGNRWDKFDNAWDGPMMMRVERGQSLRLVEPMSGASTTPAR